MERHGIGSVARRYGEGGRLDAGMFRAAAGVVAAGSAFPDFAICTGAGFGMGAGAAARAGAVLVGAGAAIEVSRGRSDSCATSPDLGPG